ncbi:MAG: hypothetical protein ACYDCO_09390 [Armatimonadota bacterium]
MRLHSYIVALLLLCSLALPTFAAEDTPEALAKRVRELERANLVLQEKLGQTQLILDDARTQLKTAARKLDEEAAARKALTDALNASTATQQDLIKKLAALTDKVNGMGNDQQTQATGIAGLNQKMGALEKALADQTAKHDKDIADVRTTFTAGLDKVREDYGKEFAAYKDLMEQKMAALRADLDKERNERLAADEAADKARAKIVKQQKNDRTITYVMGGLLGGLAAAK